MTAITVPLYVRFAVKQNVNDNPRQVGVVTAVNSSHAQSKAVRLFNNRVWVERL